MALEVGLEPTTDRLTADCSTTELFRKIGAENGARTRDPDLGKVVLYQLSYSSKSMERVMGIEPT